MSRSEELEQALSSALGSDFPHLERLLDYLQEVHGPGRLAGVTGLKEPEEMVWELVVDSLEGSRYCQGKVLDLGTGGGVPGIPLAIARPDCQFFLLDSNQKKIVFLEQTVAALELTNVSCQAGRSEELARDPSFRGGFDVVVSKAVCRLSALIEVSVPFLTVGGELLAYKGPRLDQELQEATRALTELRAEVSGRWDYRLREKSYSLCLVRKVGETPSTYPRRVGVPAKRPL